MVLLREMQEERPKVQGRMISGFKQAREGKAAILVPEERKVSKKLPVFYNPAMKLNRDIAVLLLNSVKNKSMHIALPLAGTGVRGIRFLLELKKGKVKSISFNDYNEKAVEIIKENISLNRIKKGSISVTKNDANLFLLESKGFDYIDIDPFGSPNYFLDSAVKRLSRESILAVTATDTSSLAGSFPSACIRKYWAVPTGSHLMHEAGLRILIRKAQLVGAQFEKALTPIYSYAVQHYMRVFFRCGKGKTKVDEIMKQHGMMGDAGPMWLGQLWDRELASAIARKSGDEVTRTIAEESRINAPGFYEVHKVCKKLRLSSIPRIGEIISGIRKKGFKASRTHFSPLGVRTDMKEKDFERVVRKLSLKL